MQTEVSNAVAVVAYVLQVSSILSEETEVETAAADLDRVAEEPAVETQLADISILVFDVMFLAAAAVAVATTVAAAAASLRDDRKEAGVLEGLGVWITGGDLVREALLVLVPAEAARLDPGP